MDVNQERLKMAHVRGAENNDTIFLEEAGHPPIPMSCLVWNYRGLGNRRTLHELASIVREKDPSVMFLYETWLEDKRMKVL